MAITDLYQRAREAVEKANYDYAIELFREVLRQDQEHTEARVALRGTERRRLQERPPSAVQKILGPLVFLLTSVKAAVAGFSPRKRLGYYEDFLEWNPNHFGALLGAGKAARAAGFNNAASTILKDALKVKPYHKAGLRLASEVLEGTGNRKDALTYLSRLAQLRPTDRDLQLKIRDLQAMDHMKTYKIDEAAGFRDWVREKPEAPGAAEEEEVAEAEPMAGRIERARQEVEQDPENTTKIALLAELYEDAGDRESAERVLRESLERMPDNYMLRERLGDMQLRARERAVKEARTQLEKEPERAELKEKLSELQRGLNEFAVQQYRWRVKEHPTDLNLQFRLGRALYAVGDFNGAIAACQRSSSAPGLAIDSARLLGLCFMRKNQHDLAVEQFRHAIEQHPQLDETGKDLLYNLAEAYQASGNEGEALRLYKKIYSTDINFRDVARKVDALSS